MQQLKMKVGSHKQVDAVLKFSISGNGLEMARWINVAFSRTNTGFKMIFPNTCCVLRITEHDVHSKMSVAKEEQNPEANDSFTYPVVVAISSFQSMIKSLRNKGLYSFWGKAASFILGQHQTEAANLRGCSGQRGQFALPWLGAFVAGGYSALSKRERNT